MTQVTALTLAGKDLASTITVILTYVGVALAGKFVNELFTLKTIAVTITGYTLNWTVIILFTLGITALNLTGQAVTFAILVQMIAGTLDIATKLFGDSEEMQSLFGALKQYLYEFID